MNSPFILVIFGATGDLAQHKLLPALFSLYKQRSLPEQFFIFGFSRRPLSSDEYRGFIKSKLHGEEKELQEFLSHVQYQQGIFDEVTGYNELIEKLNALDKQMGACIMRIFYLATPPVNYDSILDNLRDTKLSEGCGQGSDKWTRVAIEKPFGKDLETARQLDRKLAEIFDEKQIFRVDHYLGKETVQNIIAFRFANGIFEPIWNKEYIDHVQITWAEEKGLESRGKFFDGVGMLRDVAQNHLMQLIATVVMEQPQSFTKVDIRNARAKAIQALRCYAPEQIETSVVRGQYEGYTKETDVAPDSRTETYVAMKLAVDTERFEGVPFYVRAGKKLARNTVEISIVFRQTCHLLFKEYGCPEIGNVLTIRIQPNEGIGLRTIVKKPGVTLELGTVTMGFTYEQEFGGKGGDAYEKILLDIFAGDQVLFNRSDELESSWSFISTILEGWEKEESHQLIPQYAPGSWGPKEGTELIERDGRKWIE